MKIIRNVFYVNTIIETGYIYRDMFSIFPVEIPKNLDITPTYYPVIIEVNYEGEDFDPLNTDSEKHRQINNQIIEFYSKKISQILSLLSVFTIFHFKMPSNEIEWYYNGKNNITIFPFYHSNENNSDKNLFTEIKTLTEYSTNPEYLNSINGKFILPENIDKLFDLFFNLNDEFSEKYYKAIKLFHTARNIYYESGSLSFAAFISSIETLAQFHYSENKICNECKQTQYSATRKFKDFFIKYGVGKFLDKKFVMEIYDLRSKILHRGEILIWELEKSMLIESNIYIEREKQSLSHQKLYYYSRAAIVNFLLKEAKLKSPN